MQPKPSTADLEYYEALIRKYDAFLEGRLKEDIQVYFSREIIRIMRDFAFAETQPEVIQQQIDQRAKNTLLLLLALYRNEHDNTPDELTEKDQETIRNLMASILNS